MAIIVALILLILGTVLLLWGADWVVGGVRDFSQRCGISLLVLGIVLVGLEPEEMLTAAWASGQGAGRLALGDVIGTNLTLLTLALGLAAVMGPLLLKPTLRRQALITTLISLPPLVLLLLFPINRLLGIFLFVLFAIYIVVLLRTDRQVLERLAIVDERADDDDDMAAPVSEGSERGTIRLPELHADMISNAEYINTVTLVPVPERVLSTHAKPSTQQKPFWLLIIIVLGGLIALAVGGLLVVRGALQLAAVLGLDQEVIGSTIVALGSGAEMIALAVVAVRKHQEELFVGGVLGSFAYNLLISLGLAAIVRSLPSLPTLLYWSTGGMIVIYLLVFFGVWRGKFGRIMGASLIVLYLVYLLFTLVSGILLAR